MSAYLLICMYALVCACVYACELRAGAAVDIHVFFKPCTDYSFEPESLTELGALQLAQTCWPVSLILLCPPFQGWE